MSFLLPTDSETLAEALALVDTFDVSGDVATPENQHRGPDAGVVVSENAGDKHERARTKRKSAWYSARLRARKKNELLQLQELVVSLEMQLERLRCERPNAHGTMPKLTDGGGDTRLQSAHAMRAGHEGDKPLFWLQKAAEEALQRQKAEQLNAQLKTLLRRMMENFTVLHGAFGNLQSLSSNCGPVGCCPSSSPMGLPLCSNAAALQLEDLREDLDKMYLHTGAARAAVSENYESRTKRNAQSGGISLQMSSSTPIACDLDSASRIFWTGMQLKHYDRCYKERLQRLQPSVNYVVKSYVVRARDEAGERTLHGVTCARKVEERDRIVYMWASATVPSDNSGSGGGNTCELHFRENGWAMLSRAPDDLEHRSVFQTSYEVRGEPGGTNAAKFSPTQNSSRLCRSVVEVLSSTLRATHEQLQDPSGPVAPRIGCGS